MALLDCGGDGTEARKTGSNQFPVKFFAQRAYRFFLVMLAGALFSLVGAIAIYHEPTTSRQHNAGVFVTFGCFIVYATAAVWYGYRIVRGTWRDVWKALDEAQQRCASLRPRSAITLPSISGADAVRSFLVTACVATLFARFFLNLHHALPHWHERYLVIFLSPLLLGSGTLIATFSDRTWWRLHMWGWIIGFNALTAGLTPIIACAMIAFSA